MEQHALGARSYSPTALQNYARCPYRFFLQAIHGLAPREMPEAIDELDPLQRGSLDPRRSVRACSLASGSERPSPRPARQSRPARSSSSTPSSRKSPPAIETSLHLQSNASGKTAVAAIRADLREWLRRASQDDSGLRAAGTSSCRSGSSTDRERRQADPQSVPGAVDLDCGIQLRGSIDLVERHPSGLVRVTDHKTGKVDGKPARSSTAASRSSRCSMRSPPRNSSLAKPRFPSGRLYFCTAAGGFTEQIVALDDRGARGGRSGRRHHRRRGRAPFLPAAPDKGQCDRCDFRVVCGPYEERRAARKPQRNLEPLFGLARHCHDRSRGRRSAPRAS